jgi:hypothetical protein
VAADETNPDLLAGQHAMFGKSRRGIFGVKPLRVLEQVPCIKIVGHGGNGLIVLKGKKLSVIGFAYRGAISGTGFRAIG